MSRAMAARALTAALAAGVVACGAPPWRMGAPLDGRPSIPPHSARETPAESRAAAAAARKAGQPVLEVAALEELDSGRLLTKDEAARLADLLVARAADFHDRGRAIPADRDLETVARLDPKRGEQMTVARVVTATAAAAAWRAIGATAEAREAAARATALNGGVPPVLPAGRAPGATPPAATAPAVEDVASWVLGGPSLSARLLPQVAARPALLDEQARALRWVDLLLDEDPTSPDVLELAALVFGRARRYGGADRMLMELAYHTPDRAAGLARGAAVWDRLGRPREACARWIEAARWRDDPEDPLWLQAISCARRDPGAGDWREIREYVLGRAKPERREALAAALDGTTPVDAGADAGRDGDAQVQ
jgi:tetratricopeptide (TPR) repeat protein